MSVPEGLPEFIERLKKAEAALAGYIKRHEQLLEDHKKDDEYDTLESLPGLMWVQHDLIETFKNIGFEKTKQCKCNGEH